MEKWNKTTKITLAAVVVILVVYFGSYSVTSYYNTNGSEHRFHADNQSN